MIKKSTIRKLNIFLLVTLLFVSSIYLKNVVIPKLEKPVLASEENCDCDGKPLPTITFPTWFPKCPTKTPTPGNPTPTPIKTTPTPTPTIGEGFTPTPTIPGEVTPTPTTGGGQGGSVGGGDSGGGGGGQGGGGCGNAKPGNAILRTALPAGTGKVKLSWIKANGADHYSLVYGLSSGNYIYGAPDTGETDNFTVSDLDPGKAYCFAIRPANGCMPGDLSNEICTGAGPQGGLVLGASTGEVLGLSATGGSKAEIIKTLTSIAGFSLLILGFTLSQNALSKNKKEAR